MDSRSLQTEAKQPTKSTHSHAQTTKQHFKLPATNHEQITDAKTALQFTDFENYIQYNRCLCANRCIFGASTRLASHVQRLSDVLRRLVSRESQKTNWVTICADRRADKTRNNIIFMSCDSPRKPQSKQAHVLWFRSFLASDASRSFVIDVGNWTKLQREMKPLGRCTGLVHSEKLWRFTSHCSVNNTHLVTSRRMLMHSSN